MNVEFNMMKKALNDVFIPIQSILTAIFD